MEGQKVTKLGPKVLAGMVFFFNTTKGLGKINGEDGVQYFVHYSDIVQTSGPRMLAEGQSVTFNPRLTDQGWKALNVRPDGGTVLNHNNDAARLQIEDGRMSLRIDVTGRVYALKSGKAIRPTYYTQGLKAYAIEGAGHLSGFDLKLPATTGDRAFLLLGKNKRTCPEPTSRIFKNVQTGSYLLVCDSFGRLKIFNLGIRVQPRERWVIIEERLYHLYNLAGATYESLFAQTPTTGMIRDNHEFVGALMDALELMNKAKASGEASFEDNLATELSQRLVDIKVRKSSPQPEETTKIEKETAPPTPKPVSAEPVRIPNRPRGLSTIGEQFQFRN